MIAETVSVGTELLLGQIVDTNAAYLARVLSGLGISLFFRSTVGDNPDRMREALRLAFSRSDLVITIGGLGPTQDDLTKEILCEVLGVDLVPDAVEEQKLKAWLAQRNSHFPPSVLKQALMPKTDGRAFPNPTGTAPGIVVEKNGKIGICLPGPPNELIPMTEQSVVPYLSDKTHGERTVIRSRTLRIVGVGESIIEERIKDLMQDANPSVAPYAKLAEVHLRVTARASSEDEAEALITPRVEQIRDRLGSALYGEDEQTLESVVVGLLRAQRKTVATAESCTGGLLASRITSISGASEVFRMGVVTYSNDAKSRLVGVRPSLIQGHGAVSQEVADAMAIGIRVLDGADFGIAITGIAGPGGGTKEKPSGLVYVALDIKSNKLMLALKSNERPVNPLDLLEKITRIERNVYLGGRVDVQHKASQTALAMLYHALLSTS